MAGRDEEDRGPRVPKPDESHIYDGLVRVVVSYAILELLRKAPSKEEYSRFLDELYADGHKSLRQTLKSSAFLGPSKTLTENVLIDEGWDKVIALTELRAPWLLEADITDELQKFFASLEDHIGKRKKSLQPDVRPIWQTVVEEMKSLRGVVLQKLTPSWHIRHWIPANRITGTVKRTASNPWVVMPQPVGEWEYYLGEEKVRTPATFILQRGRIEPRTYRHSAELMQARGRYLATLASYLPCWRKSLADRIERGEDGR